MSSSPCDSSSASTTSTVNCWCTTQLHQANYTWAIDNFSSRVKKETEFDSPTFSSVTSDRFQWFLQLHPSNEPEISKNYISLFLYLSPLSKGKRAFAKYHCWIVNKGHQKTGLTKFLSKDFDVTLEEDNDDHSCGWEDFCYEDEFFKNELLVNDRLTISCAVTFFETDEKIIETLLNHQCFTAPLQHLSENLASVLENPDFTDVVLSVQGKDYPAHKVMLAARSKVFDAMFRYDTMEKQQNRVEITDMTEEVTREMLRYVYTGVSQNVEKLADNLLAAAEKYDLSDLKNICEETLYNKVLSVENAPNLLILADMYHVKELKSNVIKFIVDKSTEVLNTTNWYKIMLSNPRLLNEVCLAFSQRLTTSCSNEKDKTE